MSALSLWTVITYATQSTPFIGNPKFRKLKESNLWAIIKRRTVTPRDKGIGVAEAESNLLISVRNQVHFYYEWSSISNIAELPPLVATSHRILKRIKPTWYILDETKITALLPFPTSLCTYQSYFSSASPLLRPISSSFYERHPSRCSDYQPTP